MSVGHRAIQPVPHAGVQYRHGRSPWPPPWWSARPWRSANFRASTG